MILIFGGTTEGRKAAAVCEEAGKPFYYSTKSNSQVIEIANGIHITGGMDENQMLSFCREKDIRLIVDAAHPFAEALHNNIAVVSEQLKLPVVRYERNYSKREKDLLWFDSYNEVIDYLEKNIINNLLALTGVNTVSKLKPYWQNHNCRFRISIPNGEKIARKTFNPKLGVVGGISIIGTSGIVKPFSSDAFIASIRREMQVANALGCKHVVINSGAKSERFIKNIYPMLRNQAFIHYGNFIGETIKIASELGIKQLTLGIMIGKAVKLAEDSLDTLSKKVVMNKNFLLEVAQKAGCSKETLQAIPTITMARQLWDIIPKTEHAFFSRLIKMCYDVCKPLFTNGTLEVLLIDENGNRLDFAAPKEDPFRDKIVQWIEKK